MRFTSDEIRQLEYWIARHLHAINQSNPDEVAKYIVSVLTRDKIELKDLQSFCLADFQQFLKDKTPKFIDSLRMVLIGGRSNLVTMWCFTFYITLIISFDR